MIWLSSPAWGRWILVAVVTLGLVYVEVRPEPVSQHPFATRPILAGEAIGPENTELRSVPVGLFEALPESATASRLIPTGSPVLAVDVGDARDPVPTGWWVVSLDLPPNAREGDRVRVVVVDSGLVVEGYVAAAPDPDPFSHRGGGVAVPGEHAAAIAGAVADGRVVVLISTG